MDDTEVDVSAAYARKAARTLLVGALSFAVLAVLLIVAAVADEEPTGALAWLAGLGFAFLSAMLLVMAGRARRAHRGASEQSTWSTEP